MHSDDVIFENFAMQKFKYVIYYNSIYRIDGIQFCLNHFGTDNDIWTYKFNTFYFKNEEDAIFFKLSIPDKYKF